MASGVADGFLFGALMAQPYAMPYPVFINQSGDPSNDFVQSGSPVYADSGFNGGNDTGGYDNSAAAGYANGGNDAGVGGADFSGNADAGECGGLQQQRKRGFRQFRFRLRRGRSGFRRRWQ